MIIGVSGNIGAGKSSLVSLLERELGYNAVYEAVSENPYLEDFYRDMKKWSFHSQLYFLIKRFDFLKSVPEDVGIYVQDRTIYEDVEIFAKNLHLLGYIDDRDWETYLELFRTFSDHLPTPSGLIYIRASFGTLVERISKRGRKFEKAIDIDYLVRLNDLYERWFSDFDMCEKMVIDGDRYDFVESVEDREYVLRMVREFIESLDEKSE